MGIAYDVVLYMLNFAFSIVQLVFLLRLLFQLFRASASNKFCQTIANITNPVITFLRKYLPRTRYVDLSTLTAWLVLDILKYIFIVYLESKQLLTIPQLILLIPADFVMQTTMVIFYSIIFHICFQLLAKGIQNTVTDSLKTLSEPALKIGRKIVPYKGGFDFSWIVVPITLKAIQYAIILYIPARYFF